MSFNKNEPRQMQPQTPAAKNPQGKPEEKLADKKRFPETEAHKPDADKAADVAKTGTDRR